MNTQQFEGHTPGPWKAFEWTGDSGETYAGVQTDYPPALCNGSRSVATATGSYYTRPGDSHEPQAARINRANTELMAAAPALLAQRDALLATLKMVVLSGVPSSDGSLLIPVSTVGAVWDAIELCEETKPVSAP